VPFLVLIGSVTIDSHLLFLPSAALILIAAVVCGLLVRRPANYRWLWWAIGVAAVCWIAPLYQQLFDSHPNGSSLLHSAFGGSIKTFGWGLGFHALARAASPEAVWATPRPTQPVTSYGDVLHHGYLIFCVAFVALVVIFVLAWRHKKTFLASLSAVTIAGSVGLVSLYARVPKNYVLSFQWVSLAVWIVGICIWITVIYGLVIFVHRLLRRNTEVRVPKNVLEICVLVLLAVGTIAATLVVMFPYGGNAQRLDFAGMGRVQSEARIVEKGVPRGDVGLDVQYSGTNFLQSVEDVRGVAYLLRTAGWVPGLPVVSNGLLNYPIHPDKPFVVFKERGTAVTGSKIYSHYSISDVLSPGSNSKSQKNPKSLGKLKNLSPTQLKNLKKLTPTQLKNLKQLKHPNS
jgi:hypothetical protein